MTAIFRTHDALPGLTIPGCDGPSITVFPAPCSTLPGPGFCDFDRCSVPSLRALSERKSVLLKIDQPFLPECGELPAQRAPVGTQILCHLFPVQRNIHRAASLLLRLNLQISQNFAAQIRFGNDLDLLDKLHIAPAQLIDQLGRRNVQFIEKIEVISKPDLRGKILAYLEIQAEKQGSSTVNIPLNREEMAEYLCANRSALSRELAALRKEGLIDFQKNRFTLRKSAK